MSRRFRIHRPVLCSSWSPVCSSTEHGLLAACRLALQSGELAYLDSLDEADLRDPCILSTTARAWLTLISRTVEPDLGVSDSPVARPAAHPGRVVVTGLSCPLGTLHVP
jgi:hypothetical protein